MGTTSDKDAGRVAPPDDLTEAESAVWTGIQTGSLVNLQAGDPEVDRPGNYSEWGSPRTVRAEVLVALIVGASGTPSAHRKGMVLRGARITGQLDLEAATLRCPLALIECCFDEPLTLDEARGSSVWLSGSRAPGLSALRLRTDGDLRLDDGFTITGEVDLIGARIGGQLNCGGAAFSNETGIALNANGMTVEQNMLFDEGFVATGEVWLSRAHVGGLVNCSGATFHNETGLALNADGLTVGRDMFCNAGFAATGAMRLYGAHIGGVLDFRGATLNNMGGQALYAERLTVDQDMYCGDGFAATGQVHLPGVHVGGDLNFTGATFSNETGIALNASGLNVEQDMVFGKGFAARGEVWLYGVRVDGFLDFRGATFSNEKGFAVNADGLTAARDIVCTDGFAATGAMRLYGAHIGGVLDFRGATLSNAGGQALYAERLTVDQAMYCGNAFAATGEVTLSGVHVGGELDFTGATFSNDGGTALTLEGARVDGALQLRPAATSGTVDLRNARVSVYVDEYAAWPGELRLAGFTYDSIAASPPLAVRDRLKLKWLERDDSGSALQPYEQLAGVCRRAGHDDDARRVAIRKQRARRARLQPLEKAWSYTLDATIGYGYRAWLAGAWLVGIIVLGFVIFHFTYPSAFSATKAPAQLPPFHASMYAVEAALPVVSLHLHDAWQPSGLAMVYTAFAQVAGWVLAALLVASLTGILRKD